MGYEIYDDLFDGYELRIKLVSEQFGTCTKAPVWDQHVIKSAQKQIKEANRLGAKVTKALAKYQGKEISMDKEIAELQAIVRRYGELLGSDDPVPNTLEGILEYNETKRKEVEEVLGKSKDDQSVTVFMRDTDGWPMISSHMILGNIKANLRTVVGNTTDKNKLSVKYKSQVAEISALDVALVEEFLRPTKDIKRNADGTPALTERIVRFERMGKSETAILRSEVIPAGAEYTVHLRVRKDSPLNDKDAQLLREVLAMGVNQGIGAWRGSGNKGQYVYKLSRCKELFVQDFQ